MLSSLEFKTLKRQFIAGEITHEALIVVLNKHYEGNEINDALTELHQARIKAKSRTRRPKASKVVRYTLPVEALAQDARKALSAHDADTKLHSVLTGNAEAFRKATHYTRKRFKSSRYFIALINDALALAGHPDYQLSNRKWGKDARAFLALFS